jgi:hypothetical protein
VCHLAKVLEHLQRCDEQIPLGLEDQQRLQVMHRESAVLKVGAVLVAIEGFDDVQEPLHLRQQ